MTNIFMLVTILVIGVVMVGVTLMALLALWMSET